MQRFWATETEHFARQDSGHSQTFKLIASNENMQQSEVKFNGKIAHFRLPSLAQKGCMLKLPNAMRISAMRISAHSQSNRCLQLESDNALSLKSCSVSVTTFILVPVQTLVSWCKYSGQ